MGIIFSLIQKHIVKFYFSLLNGRKKYIYIYIYVYRIRRGNETSGKFNIKITETSIEQDRHQAFVYENTYRNRALENKMSYF